MSPQTTTPALTRENAVQGTPAFIAPEQALGESTLDGRADIYATGCVAYWLLTGQLVFTAETPMGLLMHHVHTPPVPPSARTELPIPPALDRLVLSCLAKDPADRPQSARELSLRLAEVDDVRAPGRRSGRGTGGSLTSRQARHGKTRGGGDEGGGTRTHDLGIKSPLLYQLSYAPEFAAELPILKYPRQLIQRQPLYLPGGDRAHPCAHASPSIHPHRFDADPDLHVIPDQLGAGDALIPADAEVTPIHLTAWPRRRSSHAPHGPSRSLGTGPTSTTGFECPLIVRMPLTSTVLSVAANPVP